MTIRYLRTDTTTGGRGEAFAHFSLKTKIMKVLKIVRNLPDGTSLAIVAPTREFANPIFRTNKQTTGHYFADCESPEAIISKDIDITLMAYDIDESNNVGLFQAVDENDIVVNTYISLDDVEWISGNLGIEA